MTLELEVTAPYVETDGAKPQAIGRYRVAGSIGGGGMGLVLRARDDELGRDVAIKVLRPDLGASLLEREAQAMAKLSHPNVVTIYEVGRFDGRPFIAMELVVGETLREFLGKRQPWREVVAMFLAAGRGLAAAHAAGLVHRDFKPENVLIGRDGRPRVGDFGLVAAAADLVSAPGGTLVTSRGAAGTPAYMAPEQWVAGDVDARADQFAFAVALWEALWGARPFGGDTAETLRAIVTGDAAPRAVERRGVPRRIERALRRALARDRDARWPDLAALLDELARATRDRKIAGAAAAVGTLAIAGFAAWAFTGDPEVCPVSHRGAAIWNADVQARIDAHLATVDPTQGHARVAAVADTLTRAVAAWQAADVEACRANRVEGRDSDSLHDERVRCLEGWLAELDAAVTQLAAAGDLPAVDRAVVVAQGLSPVARCADPKMLSRAPPPAPQFRAEADAITTALARTHVSRVAGGDRARAAAATAKLVERARAISHPPTLASALREHAESSIALEEFAKARALLEETAAVAAEAGNDDLAAIAWVTSVRVLQQMRRPDEARQLVAVARAAVVRAGNDLSQRVALLSYEAALIGGRGEAPRALELLESTRKLLIEAGAERPGSEHAGTLSTILLNIGSAYGSARRWDDSIAATRAAIDLRTRTYGADHPDLVDAYGNLAETYRRAGREEPGLEAARTAVRIAEARAPRSATLARAWQRDAQLHLQLGKTAEGLARIDAAIALAREVAPDQFSLLEGMLGDRAFALRGLERYDEAIAGYDEAIALVERAGLKTIEPGGHLFNRAGTKKEKGDFAGALVDYRAARAIAEQQPATLAHQQVGPLIGEGEVLVHLGRPAEAIDPLERALAIPATPITARNQPIARFFLARALAESKRDVPRAIREAQAARATIVASKRNLDWVEAIDAFLKVTDPTGKHTD